MSDKVFFDSNILVYLQDSKDMTKQAIARNLFMNHTLDGTATISTQVLQEFYNVVANKLKQDKTIVKQCIHIFHKNIETVQITPILIENAIDISSKTQFLFWDLLILSAAIESKCNILYTEDLNNGQIVEGVKIVNPFIK